MNFPMFLNLQSSLLSLLSDHRELNLTVTRAPDLHTTLTTGASSYFCVCVCVVLGITTHSTPTP